MGRAMCGLQLLFQVIIIISLFGKIGCTARPVVSVHPNWNKIHLGDMIALRCIVDPEASLYRWYHNDKEISTDSSYRISSAGKEHNGEYKCWANIGGTSETVTLSVLDGPVILQSPLYIYEGENISLHCYSPPEHLVIHRRFYRNNEMLEYDPNSDILDIAYTDLKATYGCSKHLQLTNTYSAETTIAYTEKAGTISVTITPDWNVFFTGESIIMICHGANSATSYWYHNGAIATQGLVYTIKSAQVEHSGNYQCSTTEGNSLVFRLDVSEGPLIIQAPVFVYGGKDITLTCQSRSGYSIHRTTFYKDNNVISGTSGDLSSVVLNGNVDVSGKYRCEKELFQGVYKTYTDEESLHVRELFSKPKITSLQYSRRQRETMTITCKTSLSPPREGTKLQFAFYRDGEVVQKFSSSHQYEVNSDQQRDSESYYCEARTPTNSVIKQSDKFYI